MPRTAALKSAGATSPPSSVRATREVLRGRGRADAVATRLGAGLRDARVAAGMSQAEAAGRARISQARWSELERGLGANAPIEVWTVVASAVGVQLATFLEAVSGAGLPRDMEHLRRQSALVARATPGGWAAAPEMPLTRGGSGRVIDVLLTRAPRREAAVVEVWDLLLDVGAAFRSFEEKLAAVRAKLPGWSVSGVWILRGTRRNRSLLAELEPLFAARFPGDGQALLAALDGPTSALPPGPVLLWTDATATTLAPWRRRPRQAGGARAVTGRGGGR